MTGFINVWKAEGVSSAFVVNRIKRLMRSPCGHMGTLDPLASGVLPVGVGNATRLFDYFLSKTKVYEARFRFGVTTETLDRESECVFGGSVPSAEEINAALGGFIGEIKQIPPKFSAKSVNGKRSYELARAGKEVELPPKTVVVNGFRLIGQVAPDEFAFEITCGGGTYIRSLARDLAAALGTQGFMSGLVRTGSGVFTRETAVTLDTLSEDNISDYLIATEDVLPFPKLEILDERLYHGLRIACSHSDGLYKLYDQNGFYGIARVDAGLVKAEKKLC